jgi:membrane protease YdiL (CAAX protease family)
MGLAADQHIKSKKVPMAALIRKHPLVSYFVIAYAVSWAFEIPLAADRQGWIAFPVPFAIHYLASFGPMTAALIVMGVTRGRSGIRELLAGLLKWRAGLGWMLVAVLSPVALFAVAGVAGRLIGGAGPNLYLLGEVEYLPYLGLVGAVVLWLLTYGLGEEIGWRGFALPRLQAGHSALTASLILSVPWALWHLPAFFYTDTYLAKGLAAGFPLLLVSVAAAAILHTWLYNSTRGSLLAVIVFHALFDLLSVSKAAGPLAASVMSGVVWVGAVLVIVIYRPANLSRYAKQTAGVPAAEPAGGPIVAGAARLIER